MEIGRTERTPDWATVNPAQPVTAEQRAERQQLVQAVQKVNETVFAADGREVVYSMDRETRRPVVRLVDKQTKEVIRQIPAEYLLRLAEEYQRESNRL
jgi:flagellar protein FlaG